MYKALIRSRLEYGIIPYGCANHNQKKRIETIQNSILRMILGAPTSTPIKELQCELGLNSIENRRSWLAGRYVIRIDKQPQHPLYKICQEMRRAPKSWKDHNMLSLNPAIAFTDVANIKLFDKPAGYRSQLQELAPWKDHNINTGYFPMSKKQANSNHSAARALFLEFLHSQQNATKIYTDGSLNPIANTTTCAVYIPSLQIKEAYTLAEGTSIFAAEGNGILKAMELIQQHPEEINEILILSDSRSVIQALNSPGKTKHPVVHAIIHTAEALRSAGTKTALYWIPSHVGIDGNEVADRLASRESSSNEPSNKISNSLSIEEECVQLKKYLPKKILEGLKRGNDKPNLQLRTKTGLYNWHNCKARKITRALL